MFEIVISSYYSRFLPLTYDLPVAIIGTHKNQGALLFWSIAVGLPLQGNPVTCWKFCHVVHKVLREGHRQVSQYNHV